MIAVRQRARCRCPLTILEIGFRVFRLYNFSIADHSMMRGRTVEQTEGSGGSNPGLEGSSFLSNFAGERKGSSPWAGARALKSADRRKHKPDF
jgi:hypothetical protein